MDIQTLTTCRELPRRAMAEPVIPDALASLETFFARHVPQAAPGVLDAQTPLLSSGLLDSLAVLQLSVFLSEEFGFELEDEDFTLENFETVGTLLALVARKRSG